MLFFRLVIVVIMMCFALSSCVSPRATKAAAIAVEKNMNSKVIAVSNQSFELDSCAAELAVARKILGEILSFKGERNEENTLVPYNNLSLHLDSAIGRAGLFAQVHPDKKVREKSEICEQDVSSFATDLALNRDLFDAFASVDKVGLSAETKRMVEKTLQEFRRAGVDKDDQIREKIKKLQDELVLVGQDFGRNIREDVRFIELDSLSDLAGLPKDYQDAHVAKDGQKIRITTDYPDYIPFMMYAQNANARKEIWKKALNRGYPKNQEILSKMILKRHELASLLGYESYAEYVLENKMIKSAKKVQEFIDQVANISRARADREYDLLLAEKKKLDSSADKVFGYEKSFMEERVKKESFAFDSQALRPYFQFERVQEGILELTSKLFGIRYERVRDVQVWHSSVSVYDIYEGRAHRGRIFLDLHPRDNKYKHAAQFTLKSGVAGRQLPHGVLVCNFPDPKKSVGPALMDHDQVVTFFHEFGHLLHHVFAGDQKWIRFSGVATEWDFVEAPSQLLEEWAWDAQVLRRFAKHYETNQPIPAELVKKMREANEFGEGVHASQQMFYAAMSLQYYHKNPSSFENDELMKSLQAKYSKFPHEEGTHFNLNFGHLEGYSAMYYTYMWSQVIAKDLLSPFKKDGMLNTDHARRYKDAVLRPGGAKDASELVSDFLGRPYNFDAFRDWLEGATASG